MRFAVALVVASLIAACSQDERGEQAVPIDADSPVTDTAV